MFTYFFTYSLNHCNHTRGTADTANIKKSSTWDSTSCHFIDGKNGHMIMSFQFVQMSCLWSVGGNRSTRSKPTQTRGEHEDSTQKELGWSRDLLWGHGGDLTRCTTPLRRPPHWAKTWRCWPEEEVFVFVMLFWTGGGLAWAVWRTFFIYPGSYPLLYGLCCLLKQQILFFQFVL